MKFSDFKIGESFKCSNHDYRCTDIGTRVVVAIRIDSVGVFKSLDDIHTVLSHEQASQEGWFNGPPYAVVEHVFDENDFAACEVL